MNEKRKLEIQIRRAEIREELKDEEKTKEELEKLTKELDWVYKYKDSTILPTKTSVSRLKEASIEKENQDKVVNAEEINLFEELSQNLEITLDKPKFMRDDKITKAQIGTLVHMCIQKLD